MATKLSEQREIFAREFVRVGVAARAYRVAYRVKPNTKPESIWCEASKLLANPKVAQRVAELRDLATKRMVVSVESLNAGLETNLTLARELERPGAANQAIMGQARLLGYTAPGPRHVSGGEAADLVDATVTADERTVFELARRVYFTLELGKRRLEK